MARGTPAAAIASSDQATIGRPARATNAFGRPAASRAPLPAATMIAADRNALCSDARAVGRMDRGPCVKAGGVCLGGGRQVLAREHLVEVGLGLVLGLLERVHQLG